MRVAEQAEARDVSFDVKSLFAPVDDAGHIAVAVSGGSDSLGLLHLVHDWALKTGIGVSVLTVNHGLRPEAATEAAMVDEVCRSLGLRHEILHWQGPKPTQGIQAKARTARYDLMTGWCAEHGIAWLLTGHTADDQAETVAMRQMRTDSSRSLAGIWPQRNWNGIWLFRPLLSLRRLDLQAELRRRQVVWCDDASNENLQFERVRVRQALAGLADPQALVQLANAAREKTLVENELSRVWVKQFCQVHEVGYVAFERQAFCELPEGVALRVLDMLLQSMGGQSASAERAKRRAILTWVQSGQIGRRCLAGAIIATRKNTVLIGREWARIGCEPMIIHDQNPVIWDQRFRISGPVGAAIQAAGFGPAIGRDKNHPAFVQHSMPIVRQGSKVCATPLQAQSPDLSIAFLGIN